jgi:hypothetical protein
LYSDPVKETTNDTWTVVVKIRFDGVVHEFPMKAIAPAFVAFFHLILTHSTTRA